MGTFILIVLALGVASGGGAYVGAKYGAQIEASVKSDIAEIKSILGKIKL